MMKKHTNMKKNFLPILFSVILSLSLNTLSAQEFKSGTNVVSLGIGLGSSFGGFGYGSQTPAISVQFEHGQWDVGGPGTISLGGYVGFKSFKFDTYYSEKWTYTVIGIRSAYHYNGLNVPHLDAYGGLMLSYNIVSYSFDGPSYYSYYRGSYPSYLGFTLYLGGRYFFTDNLGAFLELG
jgi:hypothetical protein